MKLRWTMVGVLAAAYACSFQTQVPLFTVENGCSEDADCVEGFCERGLCVDGSSVQVAVVVEVLRGPADAEQRTPSSWAFLPESFSGSSTRVYTLPRTRRVEGRIRWQGVSVPATVRFTRRMAPGVTPLSAMSVAVDTLREPAISDDGEQELDYGTALVEGETYDVVVLPSSDMIETASDTSEAVRALPPVYATVMVAPSPDGSPFRFDVTFPFSLGFECADKQISGCTLLGTVVSFDGEMESPAAGLQVRAVEMGTDRVVSSIAQTDEDGEYAIRISEQAEAYVIRITASPGGPLFPSVTVRPDDSFFDDREREIVLPRIDSVQFSGSVRDRRNLPVSGANVRFSSDDIFEATNLELEGSFSATATTDDEGAFGIELLSGPYSVVVTPPESPEGMWAPKETETLVSPFFTTLGEIFVPAQIALEGTCSTFAGEPAVGVSVLARSRAVLGAPQRSGETVTNEQGGFLLNVDSGRYDAIVKTADETGLPWLIEPELIMSDQLGTVTRNYRLPPPIVVWGEVQAADGESVSEAPIRAYVFEAVGEGFRAIQVAETVSDESGNYRLLISPTLADR